MTSASPTSFAIALAPEEFVAERDEILRHKWLESEKLRQDVGFSKAILSWMLQHHEKWLQAHRRKNPGRAIAL